MKIVITAIICVALGFTAAAIYFSNDASAVSTVSNESSEKQLYTCGMHPEIISEEPGLCPICNMKLTPKRNSSDESSSIKIDPATKQNMGLVTEKAAYMNMTRSIETFGKIAVPDPNLYIVSVKFNGWVEKLFVSEEGEQVFKGQPLFEIYSPELVAAQEELLIAYKSKSNLGNFIELAQKKLQNFDISEDQLNRLKESGTVTKTMIIRSPSDGFVKSANIKSGDRVTSLSNLYEIVDLSNVWVEGYVYEQDLPYLKLNQKADISSPSLPGKNFEGSLSYISPILNQKGQVEIRFNLGNNDFLLKPEMYTNIDLNQTLSGERLAVPRKAVINSGKRELVFVATGDDGYQYRDVKTGVVDDNDMIEIYSGLNEGDDVIVSGQFLIDSETRLNEVTGTDGAGMANHNHSHSEVNAVQTAAKIMDDDHSGHNHSAMESEQNEKDPYDIHTCPMPSHFDVLHYGPGKCSKCNMDLVAVSKTENRPVYVCPMPQCKTVSKEKGQCPVCNMNLVEYRPRTEKTDSTKSIDKKGSMKMDRPKASEKDPYDIHTCPMPSHFDDLHYGPGKCSKCNMDLVPVSETENRPVYVCPMPQCKTVSKEKGQCPVCNMNLIEYKTGEEK